MPRCRTGTRRNKVTGNCDGCPDGTRRQGRRCVPIAPVLAPIAPVLAPIAPVLAPIAPVFGPVPPLTIPWPPVPTRCPRGYTRSKHHPYACEKCPVNTRRNNRTRMCDPMALAPVAALAAPVAALAAAHVAAPVAALAAANVLRYTGVKPPSTNAVEARLLAITDAIIAHTLPAASHNAKNATIRATYGEVNDMPDRIINIQVWTYFMEKTLLLLRQTVYDHGRMTFPEHTLDLYALLYKTFSEKSFVFTAASVNQVLMRMPPIHAHISVLMATDFGSIETLTDVFREYGLFTGETNIARLKPVSLMQLHMADIPVTPLNAPPTMYDPVEMNDVPFNLTDDNICIVVENPENVRAYSIDKNFLTKGINPRTPLWFYMICRHAIAHNTIGDNDVYPDVLYVGLSRAGIPEQDYVDANLLYTAIARNHNCIIIKPRMVAGRRYVPLIASAHLYNAIVNSVGSSHCERKHVGGIYDLFVPA